ncbi:MAG TPA: lipoprotein [Pelomicrobium sp.]|nr:lipoprotein [Pelomicrobium sp.]
MRAVLLSLLVALFLAACGVKGPLYLPAPEPAGTDQPGKKQ